MSSESPNAILYDYQGNELALQNGAAIPANTPLLMFGGSDGTNSRYILVDSSGRQIVVGAGVAGTPAGGVVSIQGVASGTNVPVSQGTSPWVDNITQFGGTNLSTGTGAGGAGIPRVTVSNDSNILATQSGTWTVQPGNTANTTPWLATINQGGNSATVKAASTAPVAADPALVVTESPNSPTVNDVTATGALGALNAAVTLTLTPHTTAGFQLAAGTLIGTIVTEVSFDGGTTWNATYFDIGNKVSSIVFASANTATSGSIIGEGGSGQARIRVSAYTSGTANITLRGSNVNDPSELFGGLVNATVQPPIGIQIAGWDNVSSVFRTPSVKAASTAATTSDQPLVVTISPSSAALQTTVTSASANTGLIFGRVLGSGSSQNTQVAINLTTYNEQTTAAQRSVSSSSASDASAGVGAQQVTITYYDATMSGPNTETVTLNGTTAVNTVNTNICFIESIVVARVGTSKTNVGTITLFTATAGGGTAIGTIGVGNIIASTGDGRTYWAHHYVANGKTASLATMVAGTSSAQNGISYLKAVNPITSTNVELQISDHMLVGSNTTSVPRQLGIPIKVVGPNRIQQYVIPLGNNATYFGGFDFSEQ